eukprot:CAMPEP_0194275272 /NCGR_PEP_ID=MMETSP0169-20130528/8158_1 /TAXON_ID=218684 /ORGANISM="Corethron pennatum, Strain L29A3" /LENGTH=766 /DNA_ID=CAMNT_0039018695 /DNA_START=35 /DNA_END=2332 /DNA_ORIENTATION=+
MKYFLATALLSFALGRAASKEVVHTPFKISYDDLLDQKMFDQSGSSLLFDALSEYGIISVTNVPGYAVSRRKTLSRLHDCALSSSATKIHTFGDGTVRRTMATNTIPGPGGRQEIKHETDSCSSFSANSEKFRSSVAGAIKAFSSGLTSALDIKGPILFTEDGAHSFHEVNDVVENGEHLEHFHSYQSDGKKPKETIDWHTDQGLFIAFSPALMVSDGSALKTSTGDFQIELKDKSRAFVDFGEDDLVFMLGDGVNQVLNPNMHNRKLRATPHALTMPKHGVEEARVWYGVMVLPPTDAIHPKQKTTFGNLRRRMIDESLSGSDSDALSLGCSGSGVARQLEENVCAEGSTYCWHRCMVHEEFGVSGDMCGEQNLDLKCMNPREQISDGNKHGDFYPACTNSTDEVTPYPTLPTYPRVEDNCGDEEWKAFASSEGYTHSFDRLGDNRGERGAWEGMELKGGIGSHSGNVTRFMWNIVDDEVEGKLVFHGLFGYLALGFAYEGGKKNGMHGAPIIMALPGGGYTAKFGLDMDLGPSVSEYVIDESGSSFRHWPIPIPNRDTSTYEVESTECFTALTFKTNNINDIKFNVTGMDTLLWGSNNQDTFAGYHGRGALQEDGTRAGDRDTFYINWVTGEGGIGWVADYENKKQEEQEEKQKDEKENIDEEEETEPFTNSEKSVVLPVVLGCVVAAVFIIGAVCYMSKNSKTETNTPDGKNTPEKDSYVGSTENDSNEKNSEKGSSERSSEDSSHTKNDCEEFRDDAALEKE